MLRQRGVTALEENQEPAEKSKLLIRAHGFPPEVQSRYEKGGHIIIDGHAQNKTVHKVISRFREQGFLIVIHGDKGHAE
jgi:4-hydroxy-3-methylbut-2-enyl diphosphate reductase IspH